jgi:hypothetical protein
MRRTFVIELTKQRSNAMKRLQPFVIILSTLIFFLQAEPILSQELPEQLPGLDTSPADISYYRASRNETPLIKVVYSRPQKKGRDIFGGLVPYDKVWRTGANEATEIRFYRDVKMGEKSVPAGTYELFTIPGENEWTVILNKENDQWGAFSYMEPSNVAQVKVPVKHSDKEVEALTIVFGKAENGANMFMAWDKTYVTVPFSW